MGCTTKSNEPSLSQQRLTLAKDAQGLDLVSPLATIQRGYSITQTDSGEIVRGTDDVATGQTITTRLAQGHLTSQITSIQK